MEQVELVFWDWNGTLLDDLEYTRGCLNWLLAEHGYPQRYDLAEYREIFGFPIQEYYVKAGFDFERHPYPMLARCFMDHYNAGVPQCRCADGAEDILRTLANHGISQVLLSASRRDYLIEQVTQRGLNGYFTELLGLSDIYGVSKVELGQRWMEASGVNPAHCVMVGDTTHDAQTAAALGVRCILYTGGHQSRQRLEKTGDTVIDDLSELKALLL